MENDDEILTIPLTEEDLKEFRFIDDAICDSCGNIGSHRTMDFMLCRECMLKYVTKEVE